ncbi:regulatory protein RecX [Aurantiacibacter sp. D1-12]|uniref:regulatory protein RecX n=1 Tax=Aurantiacibacter sp. D1-12 TaxID=2993658 RepID=UPI00237CD5D5|nr:regulatory protein RecX [Aurantiacibacter sp. D1-12]MDE1467560.1 regulatory protein RecX [Aurantiacibacter sp. D1-12]
MDSNRQGGIRKRRAPKPLSAASLEELALSYAARFATTAAKLERYLARKLRERGWEDDHQPDVPQLVAKFVEKGFVDDEVYARARASDLLRRGYGARRVNQALGQAGVNEEVRSQMRPGDAAKRQAAVRLAQRRRFGPFAIEAPDKEKREKQIAAMLRAGHSFDHARAVLDAPSERAVEQWISEAEDNGDDEFR